jgi:pSer/pThr/pTyr-binding forkhead associated (FHA) protein
MNYCPFCQLPLDRPVNQCPSCNADLSEHQKAGGPGGMLGGTLQESVDDVRAQRKGKGGTLMESTDKLHQLVGTKKEKSPPGRKSSSASPPVPRTKKQSTRPQPAGADDANDSALPFRPVNRPPTLILCALDDGARDDGEWFRVRKPEFRIGRTQGDPDHPNDIIIANDNGVSSTHVEIKLRIEDGRYRYYLRDWPSRNGTFVRVSRAALRPDQELLLGARRYVFHAGATASNAQSASEQDFAANKATRGWEAVSSVNLSQMLPKLVEMTPRGNGHEFALSDGMNVLGTDGSQCTITISGDPFVSSTHARIVKDKKNRWVVENLNSLNGIWLRIDEMALDTGGEFQIGEQRFLVRIP